VNSLKRKFVFAHTKAARSYAEELSYCTRLKVAAIIVKDERLISFGYNGMPAGEPNICELEDGSTNPKVIHAEMNALKKLIRCNDSSVDSIMFITDSPCINCATNIAESGIKAVLFERKYRDSSGINHLLNKGVKVFRVDSEEKQIFEYDSFHKTEKLSLDYNITF
jgi:dCMP deaminase